MEHHNDTFPEDDELDQLKVSARVMGRNASKFLTISKAINERILKTINENTIDVKKSSIAKQWIKNKDWDLEYAVELLLAFKEGLTEAI